MKTDVFMAMAFVLSTLSKDSETQHGCIIINDENHIVGGGYNSFPMGCRDHELPSKRPEKYPYMVHSEANGLSFCTIKPTNCTLIVTGHPCLECIKRMWQEGISKVIFCDRMSSCLSDEDKKSRELLLSMCPIKFIEFQPKLDFLCDMVKKLYKLNYISKSKIEELINESN